ncbi:MAG: hypothetical protein IH946_09080 [Bacteroidetes bacterium]|nr:hypothetical protein [Bacteroidota bacterium]
MEGIINSQKLLRQLVDIQNQADKIDQTGDFAETVEAFSKYSSELRSYLKDRTDNKLILERLDKLPSIDYHKAQHHIWEYVILPAWLYTYLKDYTARKECVDRVREIKGIYSSIEFLYQAELN